ncbi:MULTISPECIES: TAXI family TRAP transporter solute-binding subunit [unclassified Polynucleobacter]|jgi:TRAP transporter TAXI family solute receptor|uniref:TAXI family TRAP transporter solute-binding subunit n=1 Tax=unclassified Polynucleobacter TaxID=2640945 RepID=UPI0009265F8E|nr:MULTISPECIES: TAXI family TRAP transporter solute-binding subunit [unclassified Polynucleobacter]MBU3562615.1 TAXI family TRAP transporter solute-binding subunit [Polynucleobacter sp. Tro8-14-1]MEA9568632.1 TAXI family TRAP transporter solute-binding subunit [Polynucleobacter sp. AP-Nickl1-40-C4]OJI04416.1 C4-dicarboxylate ABC transporter substrate-binding protein [Polynucleobacter sp. MWH-Adler-W8]
MKLLKVIALSLSFLCASVSAQNISIATGGTGGVYYPMGGGLASVLSSKVPGMSATAEVTGGSVDNLNLIGTGKPYVGFSMADAAKDAQIGEGKFVGKKVDLRTLVVLYPNLMHVVTVDSTGIKSMKDLKGKRISTGAPGSATEVMAFRLLEAAGLDKDKDVKRERLSVAESVNAIKDRKIDAFFWVGGLPTAAVTDLANTPGTKIVMVDTGEEVAAMNKKYGNLYFVTTIPKATYSGMARDNKVAAVANILVVNANMPDDQAYKIVKAIFDNKLELVRTHQEFMSVSLENQKTKSTPVDFHPGALKYFKEKNVKLN